MPKASLVNSAIFASSAFPILNAESAVGAEKPVAAQTPAFARFADLIALVGERRDLQLKTALERDVRLVRFEDGRLEIALEPSAAKTLIGDLGRRLRLDDGFHSRQHA